MARSALRDLGFTPDEIVVEWYREKVHLGKFGTVALKLCVGGHVHFSDPAVASLSGVLGDLTLDGSK